MNIAEIAELAGVSRAAVSRYFNQGYISQEKQEAIRRVVKETGYRPSARAQTLRTKKTKMIGAIVPKVASASIGSPVVIIGQQLAGYCCVFHDDYHASYDLTKLLLEKGRKRLGYMSAIRKDRAVGENRYRGFRDAVCDMGCEDLKENYVVASFSVASGYEKCGELLKKCGELAAQMLMEVLGQGEAALKEVKLGYRLVELR